MVWESASSGFSGAGKPGTPVLANVMRKNTDRNNAAMIYGISYYPSNFLIDRNGIIVARDVSGNELRRLLRKHLDDKRH